MEQKFIQDKQGNKQLPITHMNAVRDSQGNTLTSLLGAFEDEVRGLVSTPHQEYVTVATYSALPASGSEDTIYRVSNYDGSQSQVSAGVYSEYAWNGTQYVFLRVNSAAGEVFDITEYNSNTKYADLAAALGTDGANIPDALRKGGMSVKFVQSSDNKYVQFRYMESDATTAATFTNTANWQGVDEEPTPGSDNLVKSGGVATLTQYINGIFDYKEVTLASGNKDTYFVPLGVTIEGGPILQISVIGPNVDYLSFYNSAHNVSKYIRSNEGTIQFDPDVIYTDIRIETESPVVSDTTFQVTIKTTDNLFKLFKDVDDNTKAIKEITDAYWEYGNINTDGTPILPVVKNRAHSSLINLCNIEQISCANTQYIGYCLYDKNKTFIKRWWDDVSILDTKYLSLANNAVYVSILIANSDNSDFDLEDNPPILTFTKSIETRFNNSCARANRMKVNNNNLPAIIFNFDDNLQPGDNQIVELFESKGVRCGFAFIGTQENIAEYGSLYLDYQRRGFDILNHSAGVHSIVTSNYTFTEAKELIVNGLKNIQKGNMIANGFVAPNSEMSEDFIPIVRATHAYHFLGSNGGVYGANTRETDICKLLRYSLESNTKADIKSYIDSCISDGKLLVFYAHTSRLGTTIGGEEFNLAKVEEILDYCIAKRDNLECYLGGCDDAIRYYFDL